VRWAVAWDGQHGTAWLARGAACGVPGGRLPGWIGGSPCSAAGQGRDDAFDLDLDLAIAGLAFDDATGSLAGETLDGHVLAGLRSEGAGWAGNLELRAAQGVLFSDPVLIDATLAPLVLRGDLTVDVDGGVEVSGFQLEQGDAFQLSAAEPSTPSTRPGCSRC
jgi:hypothetical protein